MPYAQLDGGRISYEKYGTEGKPQLVLLHGAAQDNVVWIQVAEILKDEYEIYAVDQPGHGKSELYNGKPTDNVDEFAEVLSLFVKKLGLDRPLIVGHSMGGAVVMRYAVSYPEQLRAFITIAGSANSRGAKVSYPNGLLDVVALNSTDWMEANFYSLIGKGTPREQRWAWAYDSKRTPSDIVQSDLRAYTSCDFLGELSKIKVPGASIAGEQDWSCDPERVLESHNEFGDPEDYYVLENTGHLPQLERPNDVAEVIRSIDLKASGK